MSTRPSSSSRSPRTARRPGRADRPRRRGNSFVLAELARAPARLGAMPSSPTRCSVSVPRWSMRSRRRCGPSSGTRRRSDRPCRSPTSRTCSADRSSPTSGGGRRRSRSCDPGAIGTVVFRHDALRVAAHDSLTFRRRRQLHGEIAERLAQRSEASEAELSLHYEEAGMATRLRVGPLGGTRGQGLRRDGRGLRPPPQAIRLAAAVAPHASASCSWSAATPWPSSATSMRPTPRSSARVGDSPSRPPMPGCATAGPVSH